MKKLSIILLLISIFYKANAKNTTDSYRKTMTASYNNISVDVIVDKPSNDDLDVLVLFHGTVLYDENILTAANKTLDKFKAILDRKDMLLISVAYPEENMILGDNIKQAEAALLWIKYKASQELGIQVKKIFMAGHSQGGYIVTRLNTMHTTNGVIANAPGPLNLVYRCELEEKGKIKQSINCTKLRNTYGSTDSNPEAYMQRSLLNFTSGFKSDILFVQGLKDSPIQLYSWPAFKQKILNCKDCQKTVFAEIPEGEHTSLFTSQLAQLEFNNFINQR